MHKDEREVVRTVAAEVRRARKALGWSQLQLAERAGLSLNYVSLIEREEQLPTVRVLLQFARALGVDLRDLVSGGAPDAERETPAIERWIGEAVGLLRGVPEEARPLALGALRGVAEAVASRARDQSGVRKRKRPPRRGA